MIAPQGVSGNRCVAHRASCKVSARTIERCQSRWALALALAIPTGLPEDSQLFRFYGSFARPIRPIFDGWWRRVRRRRGRYPSITADSRRKTKKGTDQRTVAAGVWVPRVQGAFMINEWQLRQQIEEVRTGKRSRRAFLRETMVYGLSAPFVAQMLAHSGVATAASSFKYMPTKAGGGGTLKLLWWQSPTLLNPHFAVGTKDQDGSRIFYEPLAGWDPEGTLVPILAAEIPNAQSGTLDKELRWVVWKLKPGVKWHDGQPFTADDCVFNWQYASDPATAATTIGTYKDIKVSKADDLTIKIEFQKPTPFWADAFVSVRGMLLPKHLFEQYKGANSREAPV